MLLDVYSISFFTEWLKYDRYDNWILYPPLDNPPCTVVMEIEAKGEQSAALKTPCKFIADFLEWDPPESLSMFASSSLF